MLFQKRLGAPPEGLKLARRKRGALERQPGPAGVFKQRQWIEP